jgi:hypothetical protein
MMENVVIGQGYRMIGHHSQKRKEKQLKQSTITRGTIGGKRSIDVIQKRFQCKDVSEQNRGLLS